MCLMRKHSVVLLAQIVTCHHPLLLLQDGSTCLHAAALKGHLEVACVLLAEGGARVDATNKARDT
jgi:hypothetical protein